MSVNSQLAFDEMPNSGAVSRWRCAVQWVIEIGNRLLKTLRWLTNCRLRCQSLDFQSVCRSQKATYISTPCVTVEELGIHCLRVNRTAIEFADDRDTSRVCSSCRIYLLRDFAVRNLSIRSPLPFKVARPVAIAIFCQKSKCPCVSAEHLFKGLSV